MGFVTCELYRLCCLWWWWMFRRTGSTGRCFMCGSDVFGVVNRKHCCFQTTGRESSGFWFCFKSFQCSYHVDLSPLMILWMAFKWTAALASDLTDVQGCERGDFARAAGVEEGGDQKIGLDSAKTVRCQWWCKQGYSADKWTTVGLNLNHSKRNSRETNRNSWVPWSRVTSSLPGEVVIPEHVLKDLDAKNESRLVSAQVETEGRSNVTPKLPPFSLGVRKFSIDFLERRDSLSSHISWFRVVWTHRFVNCFVHCSLLRIWLFVMHRVALLCSSGSRLDRAAAACGGCCE